MGLYGIMLFSTVDESKRVWQFRMNTPKEQAEWTQVFLNACKKTLPDPNRNPFYSLAFQRALKATKAEYGYYGVVELYNSEIEVLSQFTKQVLRREILDEYIQTHHARKQSLNSTQAAQALSVQGVKRSLSVGYSSSPAMQQESIILINQLNQTVNGIIQPIIQNTYKKTLVLVDDMTRTYEDSVKVSLNTLIRAEKVIYDFLLKKLKSVVDPVFNDLRLRVMDPVLEKLTDKFLLAYEKLLMNFSYDLLSKSNHLASLTQTMKALDKLDGVIDSIDEQENLLNESYEILWRLLTEELIDSADLFETSNVNTYSIIYVNITEDMRNCLHDVIHTFRCLLGNQYEEEIQNQKKKSRAISLISNYSHGASSPHKQGLASSPRDSPLPHSPVNVSEPLASSVMNPSADSQSSWDLLSKAELLYGYFENDIFELICQRLVEILTDMIEINIQETVIAASRDIFLSAQGMEREVHFMIDLNCLGERIVRDCERAYLQHYLQKYLASTRQRLVDSRISILSEMTNKSQAGASFFSKSVGSMINNQDDAEQKEEDEKPTDDEDEDEK